MSEIASDAYDSFLDRETVEKLIAGDLPPVALAGALIWEATPEGFTYWEQAATRKRLDEKARSALRRILAEDIAAENRP